uniref:Tetratricopeptide repeat protein 37 n=1 Tax=Lutzomyia longipalpis TaxID=7200 RepID=A0A1B0CTC3_LUTLO
MYVNSFPEATKVVHAKGISIKLLSIYFLLIIMPSEIKEALKEANAAFKNEDHNKAIKICKDILKQDPRNYMAHVLLGAIYEKDASKIEAEKYLRKALTLSNEPLAALQGLARCVPIHDTPEIYGRLLELAPKKYEEIHGKLLKACQEATQANSDACRKFIEIFENEISLEENVENQKRIQSAYMNLSEILIKQKDADEKFPGIFHDCLLRTLHVKDLNQHERYKRALKLFNSMNMKDLVVEKAVEMHDLFTNDPFPLEWICKIYLESIDSSTNDVLPLSIKNKISYYIESLLVRAPNSQIGLLAKGLNMFNEGQIVESRTIIENVLKETPNWVTALKIMSKIHFATEAYILAAHIWESLNVKDISLAKCYIQQEYNVDRAIEICRKLLEDTTICDKERKCINFLLGKAQILLTCGNNENLELFNALGCECDDANYLRAFTLVRHEKNHEEALNVLNKNLVENVDYMLLKGEILFNLERFSSALECFEKASSLCATSSRTFYWISRCNSEQNNPDIEQENLHRCILLNPIHKEGLLKLCSLYRNQGKYDVIERILLECSIHAKDISLKWIWVQLGLHYVTVSKNDEAIKTFRTLLRFDKDDYLIWEILADAYFNNGSYTSALKIYMKIVEETKENIYCEYRVAHIKTVLGHFTEAIKYFEELLAKQSMYVPALKGIAEAHFALGNILLGQRRLGSMRDHMQKAVFYATRACEMKSLCCHWDLLGNIFLKVANLPKQLAHIQVNTKFNTDQENLSSTDVTTLKGDEIYEMSSRCFLRALRENPKDSLLWYNLAVCYYMRACNVCDEVEKRQYFLNSIMYAKQSIAIKPNRWQNWNILGTISIKLGNLCLALHCFVKALHLHKTSAMSWCNLGLMYLNDGEKWLNYDFDGENAVLEELQNMSNTSNRSANRAFGRSQQSNTDYLQAWIGQAITAERLSEEAAMDLFRHCIQLGYHREAALGYSRFVYGILSDAQKLNSDARYQYKIQNMFALPRAHDSMEWCIAEQDETATAASLCLLGCLSYKSNLYREASAVFSRALAKAHNAEDYDAIACNLAYAELKRGNYSEAIEAFKRIQNASYRVSLGLAFSYFKDQQYQEAYSVYENILQDKTLNSVEQATILMAMSSMIYVFHDENETKKVIYQILDLPNRPVEGLYSACALGILHEDSQLAELVVKELNNIESIEMTDINCHHIAFLSSQFYLLKNDRDVGLKYLLTLLHKYPHRAKLRKVIAEFLLQNYPNSSRHLHAASRLSQAVLAIEFGKIDGHCSPEVFAKCLIVAFKALHLLKDKSQKYLLQKAIHLNPTCMENWEYLRAIC